MIGAYAFDRHPERGTAANFHCVACNGERSGIGGAIVPKGCPSAMAMGICRPCSERATVDKPFRERAAERAASIAAPAMIQHLADMLGVPMGRLLAAMKAAGPRWGVIDTMLGKPAGASEAALAYLVSRGTV